MATLPQRLLRPLGSRALLLGLASLAAACTGLIGGDGSDDTPLPSSTPTNFVCNEELVPESVPLKRLSQLQYTNTIRDLIRYAAPIDAPAIELEVEGTYAALPDDIRIGPDKHYAGYTRLDQAVQQTHVDVAYKVAEDVGAALTATPARLEEVAGSCATDADGANDDDCLDALIRDFGERALRRPIEDEDVAFYRGPAGQAPFDAADYADVIALLLNAPHLLYFVEHGEGSDERVPLSAYELASRLSYHFWQTMPDDELLAAARSGELLTEAGYQQQLQRIFADGRTQLALASFFSEWLENTTLEELDSRAGNPLFDAFAGNFTPGPDLREHMLQEVVDSAVYYAIQTDGTFRDFFTSDRSFAKTDDLAQLYGVVTWDGGEPPAFGDADRVGLLTRAAYLATGSANTRPVMKGVFIRKALLCDEIPAPPANAAANPPMLSDSLSTRQVVEELTGSGACASCHANLINPLGFATENFDALGRKRSEQPLFDDNGLQVGSASIDTTTVPAVDSGDESVSSGAADVAQLILDSPKPYACFTRQYFRFTFGRMEDLDRDACAMAEVKSTLEEGRPLSEVLLTIASSRAFRERSFGE